MNRKRMVSDVLNNIQTILEDEKVIKINDHFAGYFDELGITVILSEDTTIENMNMFAHNTLNYLNSINELKWQLSFERSHKQIGLFFPGDSVNNNSSEYKNA